MKVGTLYRSKIVDLVKDNRQQASGMFFVNFEKLTAMQLNALRRALRKNNSRMLVTKNRLIDKGLDGLSLNGMLKGQTGVVYASGDVVEVAKLLVEFKKNNEQLNLKGGVIEKNVISAGDVEALSKLPPRQVMLGMVVNCIAAPITGLVCSLNQVITKFAYVVNAIKDKKENG